VDRKIEKIYLKLETGNWKLETDPELRLLKKGEMPHTQRDLLDPKSFG
jgi:hypothetical protein